MPDYAPNPDDTQQPDDEAKEPMPDDKDDDKMEGESSLLPASMFPDTPKPGDVCSFKIMAVHGDEVEVQYAKEDGDDGRNLSPDQKGMESRLSAMADKA